MALLRISPPTALPTSRQLAGDLARWIKEAGNLPAAQALLPALDGFQASDRERVIDVELACQDGLDPTLADEFRRWLTEAAADPSPKPFKEAGQAPPVRLRLQEHPLADPPAVRAGEARAPVLAVLLARAPGEADRATLERLAEDRPVVVLAVPGEAQWALDLAVALQSLAWSVERVETTAFPERTLADRMRAVPWEATVDLLRAYVVAGASESVASVFGMALEQELRALKAKRTLAQQKAAKLQQVRPGTGGGAETVSEIRALVQRQLGEFERGAADRLSVALTAPSGAIWVDADAAIAGLSVLEEEARAKTRVIKVPQAFEADLLRVLRDKVSAHCIGDLVTMKDLYRVVSADVDRVLAQAEGPPVVIQFRYLPDDKLERLLERSVSIDRHYQGERPRSGFFEYVMMARRFQVVLFMFISAFGLSFLRQYREFMVPASVLLLSLGGLFVWNSVKKERVESTRKELEKARESLRGEVKRIFTEVQRGWPQILQQHFSDQQPQLLSQVECTWREYQARKGTDSADEKLRLQRQLQGFETQERRLQAPQKGRDAVVTGLAQLRGELRQLFLAALRPGPASRGAA